MSPSMVYWCSMLDHFIFIGDLHDTIAGYEMNRSSSCIIHIIEIFELVRYIISLPHTVILLLVRWRHVLHNTHFYRFVIFDPLTFGASSARRMGRFDGIWTCSCWMKHEEWRMKYQSVYSTSKGKIHEKTHGTQPSLGLTFLWVWLVHFDAVTPIPSSSSWPTLTIHSDM